MNKSIARIQILLLFALLVLIPACKEEVSQQSDYQITDVQFKSIRLRCEVADTPALRAQGLMFRNEIPGNTGMLFVFPEEQILSFWMKNCPIPIDVAFVSADGIIHTIYTMEPYDTRPGHYVSSVPCLYAIEANGGWYNKHSIQVGDTVTIPDDVRIPNE